MNNCSGCGACSEETIINDNANESKNHCSIVLVGNPKVGKSTLFSRLCPRRADDVYVEILKRKIECGFTLKSKTMVINTPGILSIFSRNLEERVARDILIPGAVSQEAGRIVIVADAKNLKRSISLALQFSEYDLPMLFVINMTDEAEKKGIHINASKLSSILGIPVCKTVARDGEGVMELATMFEKMKRPSRLVTQSNEVEDFIDNMKNDIPDCEISYRVLSLHVMSGDPIVRRYIRKTYGVEIVNHIFSKAHEINSGFLEPASIRFLKAYTKKAEEIIRAVQTSQLTEYQKLSNRLGHLSMTPLTGIPLAIFVLYAMYKFIGTFGAGYLVDNINSKLFGEFLIPQITRVVQILPSEFARDMLVDKNFGVIPTGIFLALGLVTPVLFCFYIAFGILEDSGYMSRLAILMDRLFQKMGLNGKGIIPLTMGFSCVTMAILSARLLDTDKEKNILCFLLLLGVPCAPLMAVMLVVLGTMPITATIFIFTIIFFQILIAGYTSNKILIGKRSPFIMEIQPIRIPRMSLVMKSSVLKTYNFVKEALPVFILASSVVFVFQRMGGLHSLEIIMKPIVCDLLGLPAQSVQVFIKTMIRRESGAAEIERLAAMGIYNNLQLVVNLLVMSLLSPCINAILVLIKERGIKITFMLLSSIMIYAVALGASISHVCRFFGFWFV